MYSLDTPPTRLDGESVCVSRPSGPNGHGTVVRSEGPCGNCIPDLGTPISLLFDVWSGGDVELSVPGDPTLASYRWG